MCFPLAVERNKVSVSPAHLLHGLKSGLVEGWVLKMLNSHGFHVWSQRGGQAEQVARFQPGV